MEELRKEIDRLLLKIDQCTCNYVRVRLNNELKEARARYRELESRYR